MGSKERILRLKEETRANILDAALNIAQIEGWHAVSMRKIADQIEYTAPIIYEYFANKEGILLELTKKGYLILTMNIRAARDRHQNPKEKMDAIWLAYWDFAFEHQEFYRLMYGVDMECSTSNCRIPEMDNLYSIVTEVIESLYSSKPVSENDICTKYHTYWSIIHGLISINLVGPSGKITEELNQQILRDAIKGITLSINS
jgi:AcrR family transcriptional regulator